ncbi:hypothetical protein [Herbaspirillum seropedicae]
MSVVLRPEEAGVVPAQACATAPEIRFVFGGRALAIVDLRTVIVGMAALR